MSVTPRNPLIPLDTALAQLLAALDDRRPPTEPLSTLLADGRVLAQGTPAEIIENADVRRVYLGEHFRM